MKPVLAAAGVAVALTAFAPASQAATEFAFSNWIPWTHKLSTRLFIPLMEVIEKRTEGRVKFRKLPKPLGHPRAHMDIVRTGQAGAAFGVHGYSPKRLRAYAFSEFPLTGEDAVATSVAFQRTHDRFFKGKGHYKGIHLIGLNTHGPGRDPPFQEAHQVDRRHEGPEDPHRRPPRRSPSSRPGAAGRSGCRRRNPTRSCRPRVVDGVTFPYEALTGFKIVNLVKFHTELPGGLYNSRLLHLYRQEEVRRPVGRRQGGHRQRVRRKTSPSSRAGCGTRTTPTVSRRPRSAATSSARRRPKCWRRSRRSRPTWKRVTSPT